MIGWIHYKGSKEIHPVLCWGTGFYPDGSGKLSLVVTTTGCMWFRSLIVPLDTEVEVAALLLQGYTMAEKTPGVLTDPMTWLRENQR